ncbi:DUF4113 domain-containing protein [Burkholderia pseudomallei]|uniref:DUF4113 domain-containing protein n=1 Tax=Burkholderia pseudomallei TaxID=28450 RepID=UPI0039C8B642
MHIALGEGKTFWRTATPKPFECSKSLPSIVILGATAAPGILPPSRYATHCEAAKRCRQPHSVSNNCNQKPPAPRRERQMAALDAVNDRFGRRALRVRNVEGREAWHMS